MKKLNDMKFCSEVDLNDTILQFVKRRGKQVTPYEIEQFGLSDETGISKVYNFYDNGGCFFSEPNRINDRLFDDLDEKNAIDKLYEGFTHTAYQCLYIVKENDTEYLKYYRFINGGVKFDDDQAEPDHGYVMELPLLDLHYIIKAIQLIEKA